MKKFEFISGSKMVDKGYAIGIGSDGLSAVWQDEDVGIDISTIFVGTAREICSLYRNILSRNIAYSDFAEFPKFNSEKVYGLWIEMCDGDYKMSVINSDTIARVFMDAEDFRYF